MCCAGSSLQQAGHHTLLQTAFAARSNLLLGLSVLQRWAGDLPPGSSASSSASSASSASSEEGGLALVGQQTLSASGTRIYRSFMLLECLNALLGNTEVDSISIGTTKKGQDVCARLVEKQVCRWVGWPACAE